MKLLFILLLGLGFSQTELTTRVYEINDISSSGTWINVSELTGYDLDYFIVKLVDISLPSNHTHYINFSGGFGDYHDVQYELTTNAFIFKVFQGGDNSCCPTEGFWAQEQRFIGSDILISGYSCEYLKLAITAEFPEEDTGYIEDGFEFCVSPGANLLSFPCDNPISVSASLPQGSENFITSIIGQGVATEYNPALGWIGSLAEFTPGSGYWFKSNESLCFEYECVAN